MSDSIYKTYKPHEGGGLFLKINDGDSVKLRIFSEPAIYTATYEDKDPVTRYAWIIWNRDEGKAQILAGGKSIFNQIADLVDDWGEPTEFDVNIKRTGTMLETRYSVNPLPKSDNLTEKEMDECAKIELLKAVKGYWLSEFETQSTEDEISKEDLNKIFPDEDEKGKKL